jgi:hypothetical protein
MKITKSKALTLSVVSGISALLIMCAFFIFTEESKVQAIRITNITENSFSADILYNDTQQFLSPKSEIVVNGESVFECEDGDAGVVCYKELYESNLFAHITISNVDPGSTVNLEWKDTWKSKFLDSGSVEESTKIPDIDQSIPQLENVYGRVVDINDMGVSDVLVYIENKKEGLSDFSAVTNSEGAYSLSYLSKDDQNFLQDVSVLTSTGEKVKYSTANFYNQPIADIVVGDNGDVLGDEDTFSLVNKAEAANSCITDTQNGGIRTQCNDKIAWTTQLSTSDCPKSEQKFRLGVIKHTSTTKFHKPSSITLKLYDPVEKGFVQASGKDLEVKNGGYVDMAAVDLVDGRTYDIRAFDGSKECTNTTEKDPSVTINAPAKAGSGSSGSSDSGSSGSSGSGSSGSSGSGSSGSSGSGSSGSSSSGDNIPPMGDQANLCKKIGENYAIGYPVSGDKIKTGVSLGMRWGEALITSPDAIYEYGKSASDGGNLGMNMILRICYKGSCDLNDGNRYGDAILEIADHLIQSGKMPQNGIFIHAGHNEPNNAEYRDPQQEAQFIADVIKKVDGAGLLVDGIDDTGVKLIGPNLDLFRDSNGQWEGCSGCDDPNPHPIYTAQSYIEEMKKNSDFSSQVDKLFSWAVNDYLSSSAGGPEKVVTDVSAFIDYVSSQGLPTNVIVTELGNYGGPPDFTPSFPWSDLANTLASLEAKDEVVAMLLFNSLGTNGDQNFRYHSELANNHELLRSLYANCEIGNFSVPQEGTVPVTSELPGGGQSGAPGSSGSLGSSGSSVAGAVAGSPYGGSFNGTDPCLGGICAGSSHGDYAVSEGGMLNGNFEGPFVSDGAAELKVPAYWHVWYQNGCSGKCGTYECSSGPEICRRPEYKQSEGFGNRIYAGAASAQFFTSFGTLHAGMYQHIDLGQGGLNTIDFSASASSWSDANRCEGFGSDQCKKKDGCECTIINTFKGRIGIDPTGGINPMAGSVVWTDWKDLPNVTPSSGSQFTQFSLTGIKSDSNRITVFVASNNQYPYRNSDAYWDAAELKVNGTLSIGQANSDPKNGDYQTDDGVGGGGPICDGSQTASDACWVSNVESSDVAEQLCGNKDAPVQAECSYGKDSTWCNEFDGKCGLVNGVYCRVNSCGGAAQLSSSGQDQDRSVLGASSSSYITLPSSGEYEVSSSSLVFEDKYISNFEDSPLNVPIYQDINGNGEQDANEPLVPNVNNININKVADVMELELKPGLSIVSMPLNTDEFDTAVKFIDEILSQGGYATTLATYRNIGSRPGWNIYTKRGNQPYTDDFDIRPGEALYVTVHKEVKLRMRGGVYTNPVQQYIKEGWNLISIKGSDAQYDSMKFLKEVNQLPGVVATSVAVWDHGKGRFVNYQEVDGKVFGTPITLNDEIGVFLFVQKGLGYWEPSKE